jgi:hypothetical protein
MLACCRVFGSETGVGTYATGLPPRHVWAALLLAQASTGLPIPFDAMPFAAPISLHISPCNFGLALIRPSLTMRLARL